MGAWTRVTGGQNFWRLVSRKHCQEAMLTSLLLAITQGAGPSTRPSILPSTQRAFAKDLLCARPTWVLHDSNGPCSYRAPVQRTTGTAAKGHPTVGIMEGPPLSSVTNSHDNDRNHNTNDGNHSPKVYSAWHTLSHLGLTALL